MSVCFCICLVWRYQRSYFLSGWACDATITWDSRYKISDMNGILHHKPWQSDSSWNINNLWFTCHLFRLNHLLQMVSWLAEWQIHDFLKALSCKFYQILVYAKCSLKFCIIYIFKILFKKWKYHNILTRQYRPVRETCSEEYVQRCINDNYL